MSSTMPCDPTKPKLLSLIERLPAELKLLLLENIFKRAETLRDPTAVTFTNFLNFMLLLPQFYELALDFGLMKRLLEVYMRQDEVYKERKMAHEEGDKRAIRLASKMVYLCAVYTRLQMELRGEGGVTEDIDTHKAGARLRRWSILDMAPGDLLSWDPGDCSNDRGAFLWEMLRAHSLIRQYCYEQHTKFFNKRKSGFGRMWHVYSERKDLSRTYLKLILHHPLLAAWDSQTPAAVISRVRRLHVEVGLWPFQSFIDACNLCSTTADFLINIVRYKDWKAAGKLMFGPSRDHLDPILQKPTVYYPHREVDEHGSFLPQPEYPKNPDIAEYITDNFPTLVGLEGLFALYATESRRERKSIVARVWKRFDLDVWAREKCFIVDILRKCGGENVCWQEDWYGGRKEMRPHYKEPPIDIELPLFEDIGYSYGSVKGVDPLDTPSNEECSGRLPPLPNHGGEYEDAFIEELGLEKLFRPIRGFRDGEAVVKIVEGSSVYGDLGWVCERLRV